MYLSIQQQGLQIDTPRFFISGTPKVEDFSYAKVLYLSCNS